MASLVEIVEDLMEDCGFSADLYIIKESDEEVFVDVDERAAADYILKVASEPQYSEFMAGQYVRNGKRHRIVFFLW